MKALTVVGRGRRARYVTPDLSYYWEGEGESSASIIHGAKKHNLVYMTRSCGVSYI